MLVPHSWHALFTKCYHWFQFGHLSSLVTFLFLYKHYSWKFIQNSIYRHFFSKVLRGVSRGCTLKIKGSKVGEGLCHTINTSARNLVKVDFRQQHMNSHGYCMDFWTSWVRWSYELEFIAILIVEWPMTFSETSFHPSEHYLLLCLCKRWINTWNSNT